MSIRGKYTGRRRSWILSSNSGGSIHASQPGRGMIELRHILQIMNNRACLNQMDYASRNCGLWTTFPPDLKLFTEVTERKAIGWILPDRRFPVNLRVSEAHNSTDCALPMIATPPNSNITVSPYHRRVPDRVR
jgi:hypothetical protein